MTTNQSLSGSRDRRPAGVCSGGRRRYQRFRMRPSSGAASTVYAEARSLGCGGALRAARGGATPASADPAAAAGPACGRRRLPGRSWCRTPTPTKRSRLQGDARQQDLHCATTAGSTRLTRAREERPAARTLFAGLLRAGGEQLTAAKLLAIEAVVLGDRRPSLCPGGGAAGPRVPTHRNRSRGDDRWPPVPPDSPATLRVNGRATAALGRRSFAHEPANLRTVGPASDTIRTTDSVVERGPGNLQAAERRVVINRARAYGVDQIDAVAGGDQVERGLLNARASMPPATRGGGRFRRVLHGRHSQLQLNASLLEPASATARPIRPRCRPALGGTAR